MYDPPNSLPNTKRPEFIVIGDALRWESGVLISMSKAYYQESVYYPIIFENHVNDVEVNGNHIEFALWIRMTMRAMIDLDF